jgi:cobalt-zinc-cadmium efflux system membrane fusion protein
MSSEIFQHPPINCGSFPDQPTDQAANTAQGVNTVQQPSSKKRGRTIAALLAIVVIVVAVSIGMAVAKHNADGRTQAQKVAVTVAAPGTLQLVDSDTLEITGGGPNEVGLKTAEVVKPKHARTLRLRGSLAIDPNRLVHVHVRFPGQIVELATVVDPPSASTKWISPEARPLATLDPVVKDAVIAVMWSKDLGEKKSELVDALARLRIDKQNLTRLEELAKDGAVPERSVREARRNVEVGEIAVFRAERTLRSWGLSDAEIARVEKESLLIHNTRRDGSNPDSKENKEKVEKLSGKDWARVDIKAPIDGVIVEKNVAVGDIVDTNVELFKIADLSELSMWLHAYEEDLTNVQHLPMPLAVRVTLPANPELGELPGQIKQIGQIIDPNEHMALLMGSVPNPKGNLRAGQFVSAAIDLPAEDGVVAIPTNAMTDAGNESVVFVQEDPHVLRYKRHRVCVVRRFSDVVQVRSELSDDEMKRGFQELHAGERVVSGGVLELDQYLQEQHVAGGK